MDWSPQHAMKAYLRTLDHLCKLHGNAETRVIEPKCMEFISALAAGKQSKLMLQVSSQGVTSLTLALAVAAKHTRGGRFICINLAPQETSPHHHDLAAYNDLKDAVEIVHCGPSDPCDVVKKYKNVDFAVIDGKFEDYLGLFRAMSVNPRGCIVVVSDVDRRKSRGGACFAEVLRRKRIGVGECVTVPVGEGLELTRIGPNDNVRSSARGRRSKRFHITFEN